MAKFDAIDKEFLFQRSTQKWGRWDRDTISLSVADIDFPVAEEIKDGIRRCLDEERTPYGDAKGIREFRQILAEKLKQCNNIPATEEEVLVIPGTMFSIFLACYLCLDKDDEAILSPAPVYGPFWRNVKAAGGVPVGHTLDANSGFGYRPETLESLISEKTKLIMVCNPHNPTGKMLSKQELEAIARVARKHDLIVFSDELYEDMVFDGEHISIASLDEDMFERTITVFGFSKAFGIAGFRTAYITCGNVLMEKIVKRTKHIIIHTDPLSQAAGLAAMTRSKEWLKEFMEHLNSARESAIDYVNRIPGIHCFPPNATPFLFIDIRSFGKTSNEITDYLREKAKVIVNSGTDFGPDGEGYIRINFATSLDVIAEAFERIGKAFSELQK
jgi:aspartate/methionine/tyrosine aminotransferase